MSQAFDPSVDGHRTPASLTLVGLPGFPLIGPSADLPAEICRCCAAAGFAIETGDTFVLAQKIVSKAEGALVRLGDIRPGTRAMKLSQVCRKDPRLVELILSESREIIRARPGLIIAEHRLGFICANAGIDFSNVGKNKETALLLPTDPDASASRIAEGITRITSTSVNLVIADSWGRPWRVGSVGFAIGVSGVPPTVNRIGHRDMFGRVLESTVIGLADQLAAAASLVMGEADERRPVVLAKGLTQFRGRFSAKDAIRPSTEDLFR